MTRPWSYSPLPARPASCWPNGARIALWVAVGVESYRPDDGRTEDILPRGPAPDLVNAAWGGEGDAGDEEVLLVVKTTMLMVAWLA